MSTTTPTLDVVDTTNMVISTMHEEPLRRAQRVLNLWRRVLGCPVIHQTTSVEMREPTLLLLPSPVEQKDWRA